MRSGSAIGRIRAPLACRSRVAHERVRRRDDLFGGSRDAELGQLGGVRGGRLEGLVRQEGHGRSAVADRRDGRGGAGEQPVAEVERAVQVEDVAAEPARRAAQARVRRVRGSRPVRWAPSYRHSQDPGAGEQVVDGRVLPFAREEPRSAPMKRSRIRGSAWRAQRTVGFKGRRIRSPIRAGARPRLSARVSTSGVATSARKAARWVPQSAAKASTEARAACQRPPSG